MQPPLLEEAAELAAGINVADRTSALDDMVGRFVRLLRQLPDYPVSAFSDESIRVLTDQAEGVIEKIERWVDAHPGQVADARRLVEAIYGIRRAIEENERWRRHFLGA